LSESTEVRWDNEPAQDYIFFCGNGNANPHLCMAFLIHKGISAVRRVEFISDRMSYVRQKVIGVILLFQMFKHQLKIKVIMTN
jgi:hypothetical protein